MSKKFILNQNELGYFHSSREGKQYEFFLDENGILINETRVIRLYEDLEMANIRGLHSRYNYDVPWKRMPVISEFNLNKGIESNLILGLFGLKSKKYFQEMSIESEENILHLKKPLSHENMNSSDKYIKEQIKILQQIQGQKNYWEVVDKQFGNSAELFLLNLVNWDPIWYKNYSLSQIIKIIMDYDKCLKNKNLAPMREVWIQDGRKWRVLGIPVAGSRLFLSGLNKFLMLYYDRFLSTKEYHGFMYGRGVMSYWKEIIRNNLLDSEVIVELDLSANFNNVNKKVLFERMILDGLPNWVVKLIYANLNVKLIRPSINEVPSLAGQVERLLNKDFNMSVRNLPQGLSISPMLSILNTKYWIEELKKEFSLSSTFKILCYADDISFYMSKEDFIKLGGNDFVKVVNNSLISKKYGIELDKDKSEVVKYGNTYM